MVAVANTAEGGTALSAVTTGNSGGASGTAFTTVSAGVGQTITYTATQALKGGMSILMDAPSTPTCVMDLDHGTPASSFALRTYLKILVMPTASASGFPIGFRHNVDGQIGQLDTDATGHVRFSITSSGTYSTNPLAEDTLYRLEVTGTGFNSGATAATANFYLGDSMSIAATCSISGVTTTKLFNRMRLGRIQVGTVPMQIVVDDMAVDTGTSTELGPTASGPPPAVVFSKALIIGTS